MNEKYQPRQRIFYTGARTTTIATDGVTYWVIIGNIKVSEVSKEDAEQIKAGVYGLRPSKALGPEVNKTA
jgi:hypothetical protein